MMQKFIPSLTILLMTLVSCSAPEAPLPDLVGTSWQLINYKLAGKSYTTESTTRPWLKFENEFKINGNTGCNAFGGSYQLKDVQLSTSQLFQTEMACLHGMETEGHFMQLLQAESKVSKTEDQLIFKSDKGTLVFIPYDPKGQGVSTVDPGASPEEAVVQERGGSTEAARPEAYDWQVPQTSETLAGEFAYMADAAIFFDCATGERHPVAMAKGFLKLENTYRKVMGESVGSRAYTVVKGQYQAANKPDGKGQTSTLFVDEVISVTKEAGCKTEIKRFAGMYAYMADAAIFQDCQSQERYPVAFAGANISMEQQYAQTRKDAGTPVYVELEGFIGEMPAMEGDGKESSLVVTKVLGFISDGECH